MLKLGILAAKGTARRNSQAVTKMAHGLVKRTWSEKSYQSIKNGSGGRNQILVLTFRTFVAQPY